MYGDFVVPSLQVLVQGYTTECCAGRLAKHGQFQLAFCGSTHKLSQILDDQYLPRYPSNSGTLPERLKSLPLYVSFPSAPELLLVRSVDVRVLVDDGATDLRKSDIFSK